MRAASRMPPASMGQEEDRTGTREDGLSRPPARPMASLPVKPDAEPPQSRRNDRRRLQVRGARTPVDVLGRVRIGQVVAVDEARERAASAQLDVLLDTHVEQIDVVLL